MQMMKLIFWILVCQIPSVLWGVAGTGNLDGWYRGLNRPSFTPPDWTFGAVWTVLYVLMGVAIFWVVREGLSRQNRKAVLLFLAQLALNALWAPVFFVQHALWGACLVILALIFMVGWTMKEFWPLNRKAFWLLVPYILWLGFAFLLNIGFAVMN